jgi:hypothetical protein
MPSLPDVAPSEFAAEVVSVDGAEKTVSGIRGTPYARLLRRFPALAKASAGKPLEDEELLPTILEAAPALIAAAMGRSGDAELEAELENSLSVSDATDAFATIMRLTTGPKKEPSPFVEAAASNGAGRDTKAKATK